MKIFNTLKIICLLIILIIVTVFCYNYVGNVDIEVSTYSIPRFTVISNRMVKSMGSADYNKSKKYNNEQPYIIEVPQENIVAEFVSVSSGLKGDIPEKSSYYVILYKDRSIRYVKGCLAFGIVYSSNDKIEYDLSNKYDYDNNDNTVLSIAAYENYKSGKKFLTKKQYLGLIDMLDSVEKCYPNSDKFNGDTGNSHYGLYYNSKYYECMGTADLEYIKIPNVDEVDKVMTGLMWEVGDYVNVNFPFGKKQDN